MFGRPSFGVSQPSTFGFGNTTSTSFGQPNQLFGGTTNTFGSTSSGFGSASQPIFGGTPQSTAPLFGSTTAPAFGQSTQSSGFGSSLFGNTPQPSSSGGIFGATASTSFGQPAKPSGFGFPSSSAGGLFGQTTQPPQQNAPSMFQSAASTNLFGAAPSFGGTQAQAGTVAKFVPVTGTDSVQKSGVLQSINTKHHCITCMKEYENKSLEELRWEDYNANRKGPQQPPSFGAATQPFGIASTNSSLFGQTENKPVFGQTSTAFGQPSFGMPSQTTTTNMFGKPSTGFGTTSTTNSFSFGTGTPSTGLFGASTAPKPFGATPAQPLFGAAQPQQNSFGTNLFGQPNIQTTTQNLFAKPAQQGFNMGQSTFQFGSQPANQTNVFQTPKPNPTGFNIFGQPNTTTSTFGQPQQQTTFTPFSNFGKPAQPTFGQTNQLNFGTGMQSGSLMGNNQPKSLFTQNNSLFGTSFQPNTGFNLPAQQPQQQPMLNLQSSTEVQQQDHRPVVHFADPYGYQPHLEGLSPTKLAMPTYATNPKELQKYLEAPQPIAIVTPITKRMKVLPPNIKKVNLFDDVSDKSEEINFTLRQSAKRLVIRKDNYQEHETTTELVGLPNAQSSLMEVQAKGPPMFIQPLRLRKPTPFDEYSESGIPTPSCGPTPQSSYTTLNITTPDITETSNTSIQIDDTSTENSSCTKFTEPSIDTTSSCGVILTKEEYYTVPPAYTLISQLHNGKCLIKGFTIGRVGYGSVSFPDLMDVSNLNIDELVHFRYRELTIYPDDSKKPPLGQGLNRRAQVTLDRVYPKGKVTRKLITDVKILTKINFAETLKDLCDKHGTRFVDYRPETGSWVFMVDHFSKYGYDDSDDEVEEVVDENAEVSGIQKIQESEADEKNKPKEPEKPEQLVLPLLPNEQGEHFLEAILINDNDIMISEMQDADTDSVITTTMNTTDDFFMDTPAETIGSIDINITPVLSSTSLHKVKTRRDLYQSESDEHLLMKSALFVDEEFVPVNIESDNIETISKTGGLLKDFAKPIPSKKRISQEDKEKPRAFTLHNKSCTIPITKSLYTNRNYMDLSLFKGRSFKVGWGKGLVLATAHNIYQSVSSNSNIKHRVEISDVSNLTNFDPFLDSLPEHLQIVFETSEVKVIDGIPFFTIHHSNAGLLRHQILAIRTYRKDSTKAAVEYYREIWDLVVALWNEGPSRSSKRVQLSKWFQRVLGTAVDKNLKHCEGTDTETILKRIFIHLLAYQLAEATNLAVKHDLPNLSLLIAQMNLSDFSKSVVLHQIDQWKSFATLDHMNGSMRKLYILLSGSLLQDTDVTKSNDLVNICDNLSWRQCIAVMLWYVTSNAQPIAHALNLYAKCFEEDYIAQKPIPRNLPDSTGVYDIQYHLMMLYINRASALAPILQPQTHTSYGGDYRLSWLLLQVLTALDVGIMNEDIRTYLTTSFSMQLESLNLPKWAIFVLLFIKDVSLRKNLIMRSLHRNLSPTSDTIEDDLVKEFCIPPEWIHEVKFCKASLLGMHWHCYKHLSYTKRWNESHQLAMKYIIPDLIVNEKFDILKNIFGNLQDGHANIQNWDIQGGLLLDFMKIITMFGENNGRVDKDEALSVHSALLDVCRRLQLYPLRTPKEIGAVSELSKRCYIYGKYLLCFLESLYEGFINTITEQELAHLIMPADYIFEDFVNAETGTDDSMDTS